MAVTSQGDTVDARFPKEQITTKNENFYQRNVFEIPFRSFGINFSYKFGKLDYKARQRRSRINNDDQQSDGNQGQSF